MSASLTVAGEVELVNIMVEFLVEVDEMLKDIKEEALVSVVKLKPGDLHGRLSWSSFP